MPAISLKNDQVPFLLGGSGSLAVETGDLAVKAPIPADATRLLAVSFDAGGAQTIALGRAESLKIAVRTSGAVELIPIFATSPAATRRALDEHGLGDFFAAAANQEKGILCFRTTASTAATGSGSFRYAALKATVELEAGADAGYAFLRPFDRSLGVQKVLADFFHEVRLPDQVDRVLEPGEAIALRFGGYLRLGTEMAAGYRLAGTKALTLGQLALSEQYDLSIVGRIGLSAGVAGRFGILITAADRPGWARVQVRRQATKDLKVAADVTVGFTNALDLPGSAHEFLGAALGVNGKNFINLFNRALELSDFATFRVATDGLAQQFVEAVIGKSFDVLSSKAEFETFMATAARVVKSVEQVEDRAVTLFDRYFDRLTPLTQFLERIQSLAADAGGEARGSDARGGGNDALAALRGQLDPEQWAMLAQLTDGDPLAFLLDQVTVDGRRRSSVATLKARADAGLALIRDRAHDDLRRVITTAKQQFGIDQFIRALATIDTPDELRAVANQRLGLFVRRLVGRALDSSANIKQAFAEVRAVLQNVDAFATRLFTTFKEASNRSYRVALHAEYSRASESDALVDVVINLANPRGRALMRDAGRGDFEQVLTITDADVVQLREGVFTHRTRRQSPFKVNIVGWHRDYQYEGFDRVISEAEQRLVPSEHGITVYTTASLEIERERRRRDETVHVNFLLRALGESAGVVKSRPRDRDYVVDALSSLQVRYQLDFTDEDTSEMELRDYLAFAADLGLAEQGATFEQLAPLLVRQAGGGFGDVRAAYDVRFGPPALDALLAVKSISPAAEMSVRQALRQIVLANYLKSKEVHDVAFAYATPGVFAVFRDEGAAKFAGHSRRSFAVRLSAAIAAPASVELDTMELNVLATLFNIENALIKAMRDLYKVLGGAAIDLAKFEKALASFGDAMKQFDDFDQATRRSGIGTNTLFVVFDRLVRMAQAAAAAPTATKGPPSATASVLRLTSRAGDRSVEKLFLSAGAASTD